MYVRNDDVIMAIKPNFLNRWVTLLIFLNYGALRTFDQITVGLHLDSLRPRLEEPTFESPQIPSSSSASPVSPSAVASSIAASSGGKEILQTVPAILGGLNGCSKVVRCFLEPDSQTSFARHSVVDELGLDGKQGLPKTGNPESRIRNPI